LPQHCTVSTMASSANDASEPELALAESDFDLDEPLPSLALRLAHFGNGVHRRLLYLGLACELTIPQGNRLRFGPLGGAIDSWGLSLHVHPRSSFPEGVVELGLRVPTVRTQSEVYRSLKQRFQTPETALMVVSMLEALPDLFEFGAAGATKAIPSPLPVDELRQTLWQATASAVPFVVTMRLAGTDVCTVHGIGEQLSDAIAALVPLVSLLFGTIEDAPASVAARKPHVELKGREHDAPRRRRRKPPNEREDDGALAPPSIALPEVPALDSKQHAAATTDDEAASSELARIAATSSVGIGPGVRGVTAPVGRPGLYPRTMLRRARANTPNIDLHRPVEVGLDVQVMSGPFAGRVGRVVELMDGSGRARVRVGLLTSTLPIAELAVIRRAHAMGTSHAATRRPKR
jgi:hypothetical protein